MKKTRIAFEPEFIPGPMTFWVHKQVGDVPWIYAEEYEPALPKPVRGLGYPCCYVEFNGFEFRFCSVAELKEAIRVLSLKNLPTTHQLSAGRIKGPNSHWLSRLPASVKPWRYRQKAVKYLMEALAQFQHEI
ncbi:hypothetical protein [Agarivorans aestuarii]|uniref:hypothetical protein n=1 Tax=Agarivorans aestuarii TaxID=1563703 RepID=UPI001C7E459D|nr:hypothetical protein [Agarivorans aestuarii]